MTNNEIKLRGKVLRAYVNDDGHLVVTLAVLHPHYVDGVNIGSESVFRCVMADRKRSESLDVLEGDSLEVEGYLRLDRHLSVSGREHKNLTVYMEAAHVCA